MVSSSNLSEHYSKMVDEHASIRTLKDGHHAVETQAYEGQAQELES